jgi:L-aminopeptidase/D-esterase-like protein
MTSGPGLFPGGLTDVAPLAVGHAVLDGRPSGCTVVLCPGGAVCAVAQRGGAPGTRETDLLRPENTVQQVHAVLLTGGSAFGLDAAGGVMRWLEERGHGLRVGPALVPIVPAAVLFDLWLGDARQRPDAALGFAACEAAHPGAVAQGNAGAGAGATVGKAFGLARAMKGGLGSASLRHAGSGHTVAALVAVNAIGDVLGTDGRVIAGARTANGRALDGTTAAWLDGAVAGGAPAGSATTVGVVATDAPLDKTQAHVLAALSHHGLSRAISPVTPNDGDTLFALATGGAGRPAVDQATLGVLGALAAEAVSRAIRNAVRAAHGLPAYGLPAARDLAPVTAAGR